MSERELLGIGAEFRRARFGDVRRSDRLVKVVEAVATDPAASFPDVLSEGELEAAYRFFGNEAVTPDAIIEPHVLRSMARLKDDETIVVVHDSSTMSFASAGYREDLGESTGGHQHFLAHVSLAVSGDGSRRPHGVLAVSRHVVSLGKKSRNTEQTDPVAGEMQERWGAHVDTVHALGVAPSRTVHVMDREADDYDVLVRVMQHGARFVIRMQHSRRLVEGDTLRDRLPSIAAQVCRTVPLNARDAVSGGPKQKRIHPPRTERLAHLEIGATTVELKRPSTASTSLPSTLVVNVVHVREVDAPDDKSAVEWVLLTNTPIDDAEQLVQIVDWYRARWVIEELFKALKSGCSFEKRQLTTFHALSNALALFLPIAWRLLLLRSEARERPDAPATDVLDADEIEVLRAGGRKPLSSAPTVRDVLLAVAALGGHLKRNGEPGWQTLGRGYEKLQTLVTGWRLARRASCDAR